MKEIWKPIEDYENLYDVSNLGRIRSYYRWNSTSNRILKPRSVKNGYLMVALF